MRFAHALSAAVFFTVLGAARNAQAADTTSTPAPGVTYLLRTTGAPNRIHALTVDLCAPGVSIRATAPNEKGKTVSAFAKSVKATAAINGGFFELGTYKPSGLAIGDGKHWAGSKDDSYSSFIAFGAAMADLPDRTKTVAEPPAWMTEVVAGVQQVVKDGKPVTGLDCSHSGAPCTKAPRTAVGLSQDRRKLIMAVVDGRSAQSTGLTVEALGPLMKNLGAYDAINLDGGGSSELWMKGSVRNKPSDGVERVVSNHLAVIATGEGPATHCNAAAPAGETTESPAAPIVEDDPASDITSDEDGTFPAKKPKPRPTESAGELPDVSADDDGGCAVSGRSEVPTTALLGVALVSSLFARRRVRRSRPRDATASRASSRCSSSR